MNRYYNQVFEAVVEKVIAVEYNMDYRFDGLWHKIRCFFGKSKAKTGFFARVSVRITGDHVEAFCVNDCLVSATAGDLWIIVGVKDSLLTLVTPTARQEKPPVLFPGETITLVGGNSFAI